MNVVLVQGTWGDNDTWWRRGNNSFADAIVAAGHTLLNGTRQFEWSTDLPRFQGGDRELRTWRAPGKHLYDYCDPPLAPHARVKDLCIIAFSNGRHVVKYACHYGLKADQVIIISGPIRKDVDEETTGARANIGELICLRGGKKDRWQVYGSFFDGFFGVKRDDPEADTNIVVQEFEHGTPLRDPAHYQRVIDLIRK